MKRPEMDRPFTGREGLRERFWRCETCAAHNVEEVCGVSDVCFWCGALKPEIGRGVRVRASSASTEAQATRLTRHAVGSQKRKKATG
jgi:hypothetical protein